MLDTASTVAASICSLARWRSGEADRTVAGRAALIATIAVGLRHDRRCGWCDYDKGALDALIVEYNRADFQGYVSREFRLMPRSAQRELVDAAQDFAAVAAGATT